MPSHEKIGRAERKLNNLVTMLDTWGRETKLSIRVEVHNEAAHVIAHVSERPPTDMAWELVEGVGHLRSALDKLVVALVHSNGRGVSGVGFPFGGMGNDGKREPFPTWRHESTKKKLTPEQWSLILAQKPYPGGNDLLWAVNEIANEDKHRKDLVTFRPHWIPVALDLRGGKLVGGKTPIGLQLGQDPEFKRFLADQERETIVMSYCFGPGSEHPEMQNRFGVRVAFGDIVPVKGLDVGGTFATQIRLVKGIVEAFGQTSVDSPGYYIPP